MKKTALKYGGIAGAIITVLMLISMLSLEGESPNFKQAEILGYVTMIAALSMIFVGIKTYRDKELDGSINFGKAFQVGLFITLVASVIYVAGWMIYTSTGGAAEFMDQYYEYAIEQLRESGKSQEVIDKKIAEMETYKEMYRNPLVQIGITFLEIFPVGLVISLIAAALLKRKPEEASA